MTSPFRCMKGNAYYESLLLYKAKQIRRTIRISDGQLVLPRGRQTRRAVGYTVPRQEARLMGRTVLKSPCWPMFIILEDT